MTTSHAALAAGRWATLSLAEQLANVGSEVDRAIAAQATGRTDRFERALGRVLELFDLTAADPRCRGHRRREILRAREEVCRIFFGGALPPAAVHSLQRYFLEFAVLARQPARNSRVARRI
jgi:hypothetical protein